ncbi:MAG: hypothetical protein M1300_07355 [Epsilonproteobacteria bacterium]|nr:hypothetical protein [Campylobacterota bacterium]
MKVSKQTVAAVMVLAASAVFAESNVNQALLGINNDVQNTVQSGVGGWMKFAIGWIPVILFFAMALGTLFYNMKKSESSQENDYLKIGGYTFLFAFIGGVLGYAVDSLIGATLLGNASCGTEVFTNYWKESVGIIQQGTARYNCT